MKFLPVVVDSCCAPTALDGLVALINSSKTHQDTDGKADVRSADRGNGVDAGGGFEYPGEISGDRPEQFVGLRQHSGHRGEACITPS